MKILVVGGGTGGHVTPIRPVVSKLRKLHPKVSVDMIGFSGDRFSRGMANDPLIDDLYLIRAGKWRRYKDDTILQKILDIRTHLLNIRDIFYLKIGFLQSLIILRKVRPQAIFIKGGYVGVPVGYAAALLKIPFITHDSDVLPGLANRLIAKYATYNAVGWPVEHYSYEADKLVSTGVPISDAFTSVTKKQQQAARKSLGITGDKPLVLVTGGSTGAQKLNQTMVAIANELSKQAVVVHITGHGHHKAVQAAVSGLGSKSRGVYQVVEFTDKMADYIAAATVVVSRAGATSFAELTAMGKPVIFVPAPQLADQAKNAGVLQKQGFTVLNEPDIVAHPPKLLKAIEAVIADEKEQKRLHTIALKRVHKDAAQEIAKLISKVAKNNGSKA